MLYNKYKPTKKTGEAYHSSRFSKTSILPFKVTSAANTRGQVFYVSKHNSNIILAELKLIIKFFVMLAFSYLLFNAGIKAFAVLCIRLSGYR